MSACLSVKNIGKPCVGKPHARFDEGGQPKGCSLLYPLVQVEQFGQPLVLKELDIPTPGAGQILVKIEVCGVAVPRLPH